MNGMPKHSHASWRRSTGTDQIATGIPGIPAWCRRQQPSHMWLLLPEAGRERELCETEHGLGDLSAVGKCFGQSAGWRSGNPVRKTYSVSAETETNSESQVAQRRQAFFSVGPVVILSDSGTGKLGELHEGHEFTVRRCRRAVFDLHFVPGEWLQSRFQPAQDGSCGRNCDIQRKAN